MDRRPASPPTWRTAAPWSTPSRSPTASRPRPPGSMIGRATRSRSMKLSGSPFEGRLTPAERIQERSFETTYVAGSVAVRPASHPARRRPLDRRPTGRNLLPPFRGRRARGPGRRGVRTEASPDVTGDGPRVGDLRRDWYCFQCRGHRRRQSGSPDPWDPLVSKTAYGSIT
jgi:hypothetical protein